MHWSNIFNTFTPKRWYSSWSSNGPNAAPYATDDHTTDENSICHICRLVDWDSLPAPTGNLRSARRSWTIRTIENHEQLAISSCKICRILSILKPPGLDAACWTVKATVFQGDLAHLRHGPGGKITALCAYSRDNEIISGSKRLVAIRRAGSSSRMIAHGSIDYTRLKNLTQKCNESGSRCGRSSLERPSGMKVIDISSRIVVEAPVGCQYVALSYVWGKQQVGSRDMDLQRPPPLIEDSISVTSSMGYKYLWIDRYCIPQNDAQERHHMISQMNKVYSSASITIIDAFGEDAHSGLPGVSNFSSRFQQRVHIGNTTILALPRGWHELKTSKWATRGWTYQEAYFSPKCLVFVPSQVIFVCPSLYAEESLYYLLQRDGYYLGKGRSATPICDFPDAEEQFFPWVNTASQLAAYSKRELTYPSDSLNAFLGVVNFYTQRSKGELLHVSWGILASYMNVRDVLLIYLDWYHKYHAQRRPEFPSWTWAGWGGPLQGTGIGIKLDRRQKVSKSLPSFDWEISWASKDQTHEDIWGFADHAWRKRSTDTGQLPQQPAYIDRLHITCLVVPVRFQRVNLTRYQRNRGTEIQFGKRTGVINVKRTDLTKERAAVLQIWEGVYIATDAYLDQDFDNKDCLIGLLFERVKVGGNIFGCLIVRPLGGGLHERVGSIPQILTYYAVDNLYQRYFRSEGVFLDEQGTILDKIGAPERGWDCPFDGVGERRSIVLV